ncbi:hypothetical protein [Caloranaerobacter sp. DY30410]|uniref:hypothetical protein n=1 Tax=Caloranaerobacter sp. DY30410 TaxID=3238305 RepID=UPI003D07DCD8
MIIVDAGAIKVGGILLPGIFQKLEVESNAKVDEIDIKGKSVKPKQATGYEDAKIKITLILKANDDEDEYEQLVKIQNVFKRPGQEKPIVYEIFNKHLNARGISKVIFKKLTTKENNKSNLLIVECEFWEYIPITIKAAKSTSNVSSNMKPELTKEYETYLSNRTNRIDKNKITAAVDDDADNYIRGGHYVEY